MLEHAQERAFPLLSPPLTRSKLKEEDEQWFGDERRCLPPPACILASLLIISCTRLPVTRGDASICRVRYCVEYLYSPVTMTLELYLDFSSIW
jgi:hypothetical protein